MALVSPPAQWAGKSKTNISIFLLIVVLIKSHLSAIPPSSDLPRSAGSCRKDCLQVIEVESHIRVLPGGLKFPSNPFRIRRLLLNL